MYLDEDHIDFGFSTNQGNTISREVMLTNSLPIPLFIVWTIQKEDVEGSDEKMANFNVYPNACEIKPNSTLKFEINYKPTKNSFYFFQKLQYFATKVDSRSVREQIEKSRSATNFMKRTQKGQI